MDRRKLLIILFSLGFFFLALIVFCAMMRHSGISMPDWLFCLGTCGLLADVIVIFMQFKYAKWVRVVYALLFLALGINTLVEIAGTHEYWKIVISVVAFAYAVTQFIKLLRDGSPDLIKDK